VGGEDRLLRVPLRAVGGAVRGEGGQSVRPAPACDPVFFSVCLWICGASVRACTRSLEAVLCWSMGHSCVVWVALAAAVLWHDTRGKPIKKNLPGTQYSLKENSFIIIFFNNY